MATAKAKKTAQAARRYFHVDVDGDATAVHTRLSVCLLAFFWWFFCPLKQPCEQIKLNSSQHKSID